MPYRYMLRVRFWHRLRCSCTCTLTSAYVLAWSTYRRKTQVVLVYSRNDDGSVDGYHPVHARAAKAGNVRVQVGVEGMYEWRVRPSDEGARENVWRRRRSKGGFGVSIRIGVIGCRWTRRSAYVLRAVYGSLGGLKWRGAGMWLRRQLLCNTASAPQHWTTAHPRVDMSRCDVFDAVAHHRYNVPYQTIALIGANHPPPHTLPALRLFRPARDCLPTPSFVRSGRRYPHLRRPFCQCIFHLPCSSKWPSTLALLLDVLQAGRSGIEERRGRVREGTAGVAKWCLYTGTHLSRYLRCRYQWR